ncbi:M20/M25/M40 family metallo-hydrolase [Sphingomonas sp. IC-56]|uniref:M20/M25/M40 family metallo-hydrolase n=1 Tax=Sphingomonas sp. IC-56 TaxID=2898529 RepID=UPI001E3B6C69|nr:M20/M25/M40 family metallo-hydrolase [Sphingomonas sp. IC-56]MCD2322753.1 M20/M25/M40 family metallo-hydrolase [Sphingomonas sp. IC-56]
MRKALALAAVALIATPLAAQQVDRAEIARIIDEGMNRSEVMVTSQHMTDRIGSRLTNSPGMRAAEDYTLSRFRAWGLKNAHKEGFEFGRGWWAERQSARMISPRPIDLTGMAITWTPGTPGKISAPIVVAPMSDEDHFARYRGQLAGKIVLVTLPNDGSEPGEAPFRRLSGDDLAKLDVYQQPNYDPEAADRRLKRLDYSKKLDSFLKAEGAVAYVTMSPRDGKLLHGSGYLFGVGETQQVPGFEFAAEDYRRLARLAKSGPAPVVELESVVHFEDADTKAYNIIADIPGTDPSGAYVMAGAHLDSWTAGDGAVDNVAGSAMVMEAARILQSMGVKPRRTIRFALWSGEEQGLLGSMAYVEQHIATRQPKPGAPTTGLARFYGWADRWPIVPKPGHAKLAAYFNLDNGSGKIRGIYSENNVAAVPTLRDWLAPFASMGATTVAMRNTGGTDHMFFSGVGIPAFQFIQDPLDYGSRLHHTSADTFDHLKPADMRQASVILAAFLLQAANAEKPLARVPFPSQPGVTNPFAYPDPDDLD